MRSYLPAFPLVEQLQNCFQCNAVIGFLGGGEKKGFQTHLFFLSYFYFLRKKNKSREGSKHSTSLCSIKCFEWRGAALSSRSDEAQAASYGSVSECGNCHPDHKMSAAMWLCSTFLFL